MWKKVHKQHEIYMANPRVTNTNYIPLALFGAHVGLARLQVGSASVFRYQHVGVPNAKGFALQWL